MFPSISFQQKIVSFCKNSIELKAKKKSLPIEVTIWCLSIFSNKICMEMVSFKAFLWGFQSFIYETKLDFVFGILIFLTLLACFSTLFIKVNFFSKIYDQIKSHKTFKKVSSALIVKIFVIWRGHFVTPEQAFRGTVNERNRKETIPFFQKVLNWTKNEVKFGSSRSVHIYISNFALSKCTARKCGSKNKSAKIWEWSGSKNVGTCDTTPPLPLPFTY